MVRFLIQDTVSGSMQLTDEEIDALLLSNSATATAILCANALAARWARKADMEVGDLKISYSQIAKQYRDIAVDLKQSSRAALSPYAGGISRSDKAANTADTDMVKPAFTRTLHDDPGDPVTDASF